MLKRLKYEIKDIKKNPIENFSIGFDKDDIQKIFAKCNKLLTELNHNHKYSEKN